MTTWDQIKEELAKTVSMESFQNWLVMTEQSAERGSHLYVKVPSEATRTWMEQEYGDKIFLAIETLGLPIRQISYEVAPAVMLGDRRALAQAFRANSKEAEVLQSAAAAGIGHNSGFSQNSNPAGSGYGKQHSSLLGGQHFNGHPNSGGFEQWRFQGFGNARWAYQFGWAAAAFEFSRFFARGASACGQPRGDRQFFFGGQQRQGRAAFA